MPETKLISFEDEVRITVILDRHQVPKNIQQMLLGEIHRLGYIVKKYEDLFSSYDFMQKEIAHSAIPKLSKDKL